MKTCLLFDLDDTLYDYSKAHEEALKSAEKRFLQSEKKLSPQAFQLLFAQSRQEIISEYAGTSAAHSRSLFFERMLWKLKRKIHLPFIYEMTTMYWTTFFDHMKAFEGAEKLLKRLKEHGTKIGVVTNLSVDIQMKKLHTLGFHNYIDVLVTSEHAGREKPHPATIYEALSRLSAIKEDSILVGDSLEEDIEAANAVGIDSVLFRTAWVEEREFDAKKPSYVVGSFADLEKLLDTVL